MKFAYNTYKIGEQIPVNEYITNRKMAKYFSNETKAALVTISSMLSGYKPDPLTPVFYATGFVDHEEFELGKIAGLSINEGRFSNKEFIEKAMVQMSPLTQFKVLYNMTLCFISIEYGFKGDNAAVYGNASGLLTNASMANREEIIIGAGKINANGDVESGFALLSKTEIKSIKAFSNSDEAIEVFRYLKEAAL